MNVLDRILGRLFREGRWKRVILPLAVVFALFGALATGNSGFVEVKPGEVAVVYNTVTGSTTVVRQQGTLTFVPILQTVEIITVEPQVLVMEGLDDDPNDPNRTRRLDVRASDGSSFWFDRLEIHYQAEGGGADELIATNGRGDGYKRHALASHAREILRNEFGRYTFLEAANPSMYSAATNSAVEELNKRLNPFGIIVSQIVTPKPSFDPDVEKAIEDRQKAEQEVEAQEVKRERLLAQKDRKVQEVRRERNATYQSEVARLEGEKKAAENLEIRIKREADKYYIDTVARCQARREARIKEALADRSAFRKKAEGLEAVIRSVGEQGPGVLDLVIAQQVIPQLESIKAEPYARAPQPTDLRLIDETTGGTR